MFLPTSPTPPSGMIRSVSPATRWTLLPTSAAPPFKGCEMHADPLAYVRGPCGGLSCAARGCGDRCRAAVSARRRSRRRRGSPRPVLRDGADRRRGSSRARALAGTARRHSREPRGQAARRRSVAREHRPRPLAGARGIRRRLRLHPLGLLHGLGRAPRRPARARDLRDGLLGREDARQPRRRPGDGDRDGPPRRREQRSRSAPPSRSRPSRTSGTRRSSSPR